MASYPESGQFYAANITTIDAGATYSTESSTITCQHKRYMTITAKGTGANASSSGDVTFTILAKVNGNWGTSAFATHVVTVAGTAAKVSAAETIEIFGVEAMKVSQIVNGDGSYAVGTVNLVYTMVE